MLTLNAPVTIAGVEVVLLEDLALTHVPPHLREQLLPVSSDDAACTLYTLRAPAERLADAYPTVPLYGLWQVLLASGLAGPEPGCYRVGLDAPFGGRYLVRETNGARSGWVAEDVETPADVSTMHTISVTPDTLTLPATPISAPQHQREQQEQTQRRKTAMYAMSLAALLAVSFGLNAVSQHHHSAVQDQLTAQIDALTETRDQMIAWQRIATLDQSERLAQLAHLARYPMAYEIPQASLQHGITTLLRGTEHLPPYPPTGLIVRQHTPQYDGSVHIVW